MSRYPREFWHAMCDPFTCPSCGYVANGTLRKWEMLDGPVDAKCRKCNHKWSCAIPIGPCKERRHIELLLAQEKRYYILTAELHEIREFLHGRKG